MTLWHHSTAQNLVPNPSFENGRNDICDYSGTSNDLNRNCLEWNSPNETTPDIHVMGIPDYCPASAPNNGIFPPHLGTQIPRTGNRMAGIYTGVYTLDLVWQWREYLQVKLAEPLIPDSFYRFEMFVSLAEESPMGNNNMGVALAMEEIHVNSYLYIPLTPVVNETRVITDSLNWVRIAGQFKATQPFNHLLIGNFFDDEQTESVPLPPPNLQVPAAYYFADDVLLEKVPCSSMTFAGDLEICPGDTATITAFTNYGVVSWAALLYSGTIIHHGPVLKIKPQQTTQYLVLATEGCQAPGQDTVTVFVKEALEIELGNDTTICKDEESILDAGPGALRYNWQDGSAEQFYQVMEPGKYSATVQNDNGCLSTDSVNISIDDDPQVSLGRDTLVCEGWLTLNAGNYNYVEWSDGSVDSTLMVNQSDTYWATVKNQCGQISDTIEVSLLHDVFIPNVITLNGDTLNSQFVIKTPDNYIEPSLQIFDRWGSKVYESLDYPNDWPQKEDDVPVGIYYYLVSYPGCEPYKGWLHVLR